MTLKATFAVWNLSNSHNSRNIAWTYLYIATRWDSCFLVLRQVKSGPKTQRLWALNGIKLYHKYLADSCHLSRPETTCNNTQLLPCSNCIKDSSWCSSTEQISLSVLVILGLKCTLAASRAAPGKTRWVCDDWPTGRERERERRTHRRQTVTLRCPLDDVRVIR